MIGRFFQVCAPSLLLAVCASWAEGAFLGLETPPDGISVSLPSLNSIEIELPRAEAIDASTSARRMLAFDIRLDRPSRAPVRMVFHVQNRRGWFYQLPRSRGIPSSGFWSVRIDMGAEGHGWMAEGHARPWDALAGRGIVRYGIRLFSVLPYEGRLIVQRVRWEDEVSVPAGDGRLVDLRVPEAVEVGGVWEMSFRSSRPPLDPFDSDVAGFVCEVLDPSGRATRLRPFIYQDFEEIGGRLVAVGQPEWRVRHRPEGRGRQLYRLVDAEGEVAAEGVFTVEPRKARSEVRSGARTAEDWSACSFDVSDRSTGWRPMLAAEPVTLAGGRFERRRVSADSFPKTVWRPMIEWTAEWGRWDGAGSYDLELAWRFDRALEAAEREGVALPMALLDDGPFLDHGAYRWPLNPLSRGQGGPIEGPGAFFESEAAASLFIRRARYLIARYGHSPSIGSWMFLAGLPASGVPEWHARVAAALAGPAEATGKPLVSYHPLALPFEESLVLGEFEEGEPAGWRFDAEDSGGGRAFRAAGGGPDGSDAIALEIADAGSPSARATLYRPANADLFEHEYISFDVRMPEGAEGVGRAQVVLRDRDLLWFEELAEIPLRAGDWTRCLVDISTGSRLTPGDHERPWTGYSRSRVREIGIRIFSNGDLPAPIMLDKVVALSRPAAVDRALSVSVRSAPEEVGRYRRYEMTLDILPEFSNPFDPSVVSLDATFRHSKSGRTWQVPGFFYEPYRRELRKMTVAEGDAEVEREVEVLSVAGPADWRVRFAPPLEGEYQVLLRLNAGSDSVEVEGPPFRAVASGVRGFIRPAPDGRYFEHETGEVFYPIGPVIRSPSDARDLGRDPSIRDRVLAANYRGTYQFDDYFAALAGSGANWIRMWLASWWCGLEWFHEWPGYHGAGWYNMQNAWRLDHVMESAERSGVYVQLCLQNHGQASERIDHEWEYNPYNQYMPEAYPNRNQGDRRLQLSRTAQRNDAFRRPGGLVENATVFFESPAVRQARRNYYRYVVARWGYSTNVIGWALSSEVEFTGEYDSEQYRRDDADWGAGRWPGGENAATHTLDWHRDLAGYLRRIDPYGHLVTTHFSHPIRGRAFWALDEIDFVQSNAYGGFGGLGWFERRGLPMGPNDSSIAPTAMEQYFLRFMGRYGKPVIIGEWGGHWMKNPLDFLDADLHTGSWSSIMTPMAGSTGFWWWTHVHFRDRYGVFTAISRFLEGEDRRGLGLEPLKILFESGGGLAAVALGNASQADVYVYHPRHALKLGSAPEVSSATLVAPGLAPGYYEIERWDTVRGEAVGRHGALATADSLKIELPPVAGDLALKIRRVRGAAE